MMTSSTGQRRRSVAAEVVGIVDVTYAAGEAFTIDVRNHQLRVDQPRYLGADRAPTPIELFVASLASCVAYNAGRYLDRHAYERTGLTVRAEFLRADSTPDRVDSVRIRLTIPRAVPAELIPALRAAAFDSPVPHALARPPRLELDVVKRGEAA